MAHFSTGKQSGIRTLLTMLLSAVFSDTRRTVRLCLAAPLFVVTLEVCSRIDDFARYRAPFFCDYNADDMLYVRGEHGRQGRPHGRFEKWQLNSHGFRSAEIEVDKPANVIRIACVGASETFGYYESPGHEWPAQLQHILDERDPGRYEVINTALPGYVLESNTVNLEHRVLKFRPDVVILYQVAFDYFNPRRRQGVTQNVGPPTQIHSADTIDMFSLKPRFLRKAKQTVKSLLSPVLLRKYQVWQAEKGLEKIRLRRNYEQLVEEPSRDALERFENDLGRFEELCVRNSATLLLATVAFFWDEYTTPEALRFMPYFSKKGIVACGNRLNRTLLDYGTRRGIPVVDVASTVPADREHMADYVHLTDAGAELVARTLADRIGELPLSVQRHPS